MSDAAFIPAERLTSFKRWKIGSIVETVAPPPHAEPPGAQSPSAPPERSSEAERAAAREQGYAEGYAVGIAQARAEAERLGQIAAGATKELVALEERLAGDVLDLALAIARQVLRAEVRVRRETLLAVVREALAQLPHAAVPAQIVLHPEDVALVGAQLGPELAALGMRMGEDPQIEPGGCRIVSPIAAIDATLATRWQRVVATLGSRLDWLDDDGIGGAEAAARSASRAAGHGFAEEAKGAPRGGVESALPTELGLPAGVKGFAEEAGAAPPEGARATPAPAMSTAMGTPTRLAKAAIAGAAAAAMGSATSAATAGARKSSAVEAPQDAMHAPPEVVTSAAKEAP